MPHPGVSTDIMHAAVLSAAAGDLEKACKGESSTLDDMVVGTSDAATRLTEGTKNIVLRLIPSLRAAPTDRDDDALFQESHLRGPVNQINVALRKGDAFDYFKRTLAELDDSAPPPQENPIRVEFVRGPLHNDARPPDKQGLAVQELLVIPRAVADQVLGILDRVARVEHAKAVQKQNARVMRGRFAY